MAGGIKSTIIPASPAAADEVTLTSTAGIMSIKSEGVDTAQIADGAVTATQIDDATITAAKMAAEVAKSFPRAWAGAKLCTGASPTSDYVQFTVAGLTATDAVKVEAFGLESGTPNGSTVQVIFHDSGGEHAFSVPMVSVANYNYHLTGIYGAANQISAMTHFNGTATAYTTTAIITTTAIDFASVDYIKVYITNAANTNIGLNGAFLSVGKA